MLNYLGFFLKHIFTYNQAIYVFCYKLGLENKGIWIKKGCVCGVMVGVGGGIAKDTNHKNR